MTTALLVLSTSLFVTFREISFLPAIHLFTYSLVQQTFAQCPLRSDQCSQRRGQSGWHDSQRLRPGEGVARRTGKRGLRPRSACGDARSRAGAGASWAAGRCLQSGVREAFGASDPCAETCRDRGREPNVRFPGAGPTRAVDTVEARL